MFHDIPTAMLARMHQLEALDAIDREDGTSRFKRLRQIPPETGKFIALLAASAPAGRYIEIGTSAGYSTLWLALACAATGRTITSFELMEEKARLARETISAAGVGNIVELIADDAIKHIGAFTNLSFCFLDAEKEIYGECYECVIPNLVQGGLLVADNAINHAQVLQPMLDRALNDQRVDGMIVPVGKGVLVCRKR
jgi:caffeoyl-CoA O-methyltransferase